MNTIRKPDIWPSPVKPLVTTLAFLRGLTTPFAIDLRSLALFRVGLGAMVMVDALLRLRDLEAFHTDSGVMPRTWVLAHDPATVSLHLADGTTMGQAALFGLHLVFAFMLALGYRTRLATALCLLWCISIQQRNPLILQSSDLFLTQLLFWSLFLPLGALASIDSVLRPRSGASGREPYRWLSVGGAGLLLQIMSLYFFTALLKSSPEWRIDRTAVFNAVRGTYSNSLGEWLSQFEPLTHYLTLYVWYLEILAPALVFFPLFLAPIRFIVLAALYAMHLGFLLCLGVGQFPWLNFTALVLFIPGAAWNQAGGRFSALSRQGERLARRISAWLAKFTRDAKPISAMPRPAFPCEAIAALCVGAMLYANLNSVWPNRYPLPESLRGGLKRSSLAQNWVMFASVPPLKSWYLVEAVDRRGTTGYLLNALTPWERGAIPENVNNSYANYRWRKLFSNLWYHRNDSTRRALLAYVCRQHPDFARVSLIYVGQELRANREPQAYPLVTDYSCLGY
jgi:hypothetical protein